MTAGAPEPLVVTVTGPESTGKSTLARRLADAFDAPSAPEYAREYLAARLAAGASPDHALGPADVAPIARGQVAAEDAAAARARTRRAALVLRDTDLASTVVYARHYYRACPPWIVEAARARRAAHYLLCDVDVPWVADGQRDRPHAREALRDAFAATLEELGCRFTWIAGDWPAREARARATVATLLAAHVDGRQGDAP